MYNIHIQGGPVFMIPLTLLFLINLCVIVFIVIKASIKNPVKAIWLETVKQIGGLAFVWGIFSTLIGLYYAFADLSRMTETLPLNVIMGGLKVGLITVVYGSIIFIVSLVAHVVLKLFNRDSLI